MDFWVSPHLDDDARKRPLSSPYSLSGVPIFHKIPVLYHRLPVDDNVNEAVRGQAICSVLLARNTSYRPRVKNGNVRIGRGL